MRLKCGDIREDGMVFWSYHPNYINGERWVTKEKFEAKKEERRRKDRERRRNNPKKYRDKANIYHHKNRDRLNLKSINRYYKNKKKILKTQLEYNRKRTANDPLYKFRHSVRNLIRAAFKRKKYIKNSRAKDILGCTYEEFKTHIESQFLDGMSWDNRHLWHIDHIMPVSMAKTKDEVIRLNHYRNLRPLWAKENLSKSAKTPDILVLF